MIRVLAVLATLLGASQAQSESASLSFGDLLDACTRADMNWIDFCNGYFQAVSDYATAQELACIPSGTTRTDLVSAFERVSVDLLSREPGVVEERGFSIATVVLASVWPCE